MKNTLLLLTIGAIVVSIALIGVSMMPTAQNIQILATYPSSKLKVQSLYIRGDGCGLSWSKGVIMSIKANNVWAYALTCPYNTPVEIKIL